MRRLVLVLALVAALVGAMLPSHGQDVGNQFDCSATAGAGVTLVGAGPSCSFDLLCLIGFPCIYSVRISGSGTGLVEAAMTATLAFGAQDTEVFFVDEGGNEPSDPPSCSGLFTCSAPADDEIKGLLVFPGDESGAVVTVRCSAGGVAAVESVSCQANNVELEEIISPQNP